MAAIGAADARAAFRDATGTSRRLRPRDPRGPRPARAPAPHGRRPRPRPEDARPHAARDVAATPTRMTLARIVLAGGASSRFGADKLADTLRRPPAPPPRPRAWSRRRRRDRARPRAGRAVPPLPPDLAGRSRSRGIQPRTTDRSRASRPGSMRSRTGPGHRARRRRRHAAARAGGAAAAGRDVEDDRPPAPPCSRPTRPRRCRSRSPSDLADPPRRAPRGRSSLPPCAPRGLARGHDPRDDVACPRPGGDTLDDVDPPTDLKRRTPKRPSLGRKDGRLA